MIDIETISAVTLATRDMERAVAFYEALGFAAIREKRKTGFTTFALGSTHLNLTAETPGPPPGFWGRVIFYVADVNAVHARAVEQGMQPEFAPRDAPWGERYFHLHDPDGHELSFARPLGDPGWTG